MSGLVELAERIEALTGLDREVNVAIWQAVDPHGYSMWEGGQRAMLARGMHEDDRKICLLERAKISAANYTADLNAALSLVPERAWWWVEAQPLTRDRFMAGCADERVSTGATPALALCAAALRARSALNPHEGEKG